LSAGGPAADPRLDRLAARYGLGAEATSSLRALLTALAGDDAPTTLRSVDRALDDHLADSLVALALDEVRSARVVADLGSGAGVPGLVLAIALPSARFALVESNARKCAFIERTAAACGLANVETVNARAEVWSSGIARFDLVTARALAPLAVVAEYAAPLLRVGGSLVAWRGRRDPQAEEAARVAADELGLEVRDPEPVSPYPAAENRYLQLMLKVRETPSRFPRRAGIARKRPLGDRPGNAPFSLHDDDSSDRMGR
jgi:16S rRNA (guanine527-N7)-methyltransferase